MINKSPLNEKMRPDFLGLRRGPLRIEFYVIDGYSAGAGQPNYLYGKL